MECDTCITPPGVTHRGQPGQDATYMSKYMAIGGIKHQRRGISALPLEQPAGLAWVWPEVGLYETGTTHIDNSHVWLRLHPQQRAKFIHDHVSQVITFSGI